MRNTAQLSRRELPLVAFALTLAALIAGAVLGYINVLHLISNERLLSDTDDAIVDLEGTLSTLKDAETGQRGYLLTGDPAYLRPYELAVARMRGRLAKLDDDFANRPSQRQRLRVLQQTIGRRLAELQRTISLSHAGDRAGAVALVADNAGEGLMDRVRSQIAAMEVAEHVLLERRAAESESSSRTTILSLFAAAFIGAALLGIAFYLTRRTQRRSADAAERILREITERKRIERQLYDMLIELKEGDRNKNEFLALLAHELRGPLAPMRNGLELLQRAGGDEVIRRKAHEMMVRQLGQLVHLVNDLLDLGRISRGQIEIRREPIDLASVMRQAADACAPLAAAASHALIVSMPPEPIYLDGDAARLAQVFGNLLQNACKYTEPGGRIEFRGVRRGPEAVLSIKDNGLGIPPEKLQTIFNMFVQVNHAPERSQGGLGIGLAVAKRLVELHGGSIEAKSAGSGTGSEFIVRLPVRSEAHGTVNASAPPAVVASQPRRVLVVDDNSDTATSLATLLRLAGHDTYTASEGHEALASAEMWQPDVILLDLGLPNLSGYDVCRRIRQRPWAKNAVVVAVTGWGAPEDRRKSAEAGFDAHLLKPPDYPALMRVIAMRERRSGQAAGLPL